jgi:hypothetical protein
MPSGITRGRATSCYFLGQTIGSARGRCGAAIDWVGFCATIIERRRDVARPVQYFDPTGFPEFRLEHAAELTGTQPGNASQLLDRQFLLQVLSRESQHALRTVRLWIRFQEPRVLGLTAGATMIENELASNGASRVPTQIAEHRGHSR